MTVEKLDTTIRKEQIAQAALGLIATHGLNGLSIAGVARRVGLVPSAIYRHFESKDDLLDAILDLIRDRLLGNLTAVRSETTDPLEALRRLLMRHIGLIRENQAIPRIIFSEDLYAGRPERKERVLGIVTGYLEGVAGLVREGQRRRRIRPEIDPSTAGLMFLGLIQPAGVLWFLTDGGFDVTKHAQKSWKIFTRLVESDAGEARRAPPAKQKAARRGPRMEK